MNQSQAAEVALRLEILRLAAAVSKDNVKGDEVVAKADLFLEFVTNTGSKVEIVSTIPRILSQ